MPRESYSEVRESACGHARILAHQHGEPSSGVGETEEGGTAGWNPKRLIPNRGGRARLQMPTRAIIALALLSSLACPMAVHAQGSGPTGETGTSRVLFVGLAELLGGIPGGPYWHLLHDPFFEVTAVRAFYLASRGYSDEIMQKAVRLYMPRSYQELLDYRVISFFYAERSPFRSEYAKWISDAVEEEGTGLVFAGQESNWAFAWMDTTVGSVLPIEMVNPQITHDPTTIRIVKEDHPSVASLSWVGIGGHGVMAGHSFVSAKKAADVIAVLVPALGPSYPFLVAWDVGVGRSIAMMSVFSLEDNPFLDWEFFPDFTSNLHLYAAGREIPSDPELVHRVRLALEEYHTCSGLLVSLVEFVSRIGGNPQEVERIMDQGNGRLRDVEELYLSYEFAACLELLEANIADLGLAEDLAMKVKDQALSWIYAIEWTVLTSTGLFVGVLVWALMMKRRLYTEVGTTRLARMGAAFASSAVEMTEVAEVTDDG